MYGPGVQERRTGSFRGCYKDGTDERSCDLRWLSSYELLLRFGICIIFTLTLSSMYFVYIVVLIVAVIIVLINFQPYKTSVSHYTIIDASFLILLSLYFTMINGNNIFSIKIKVFLHIFLWACHSYRHHPNHLCYIHSTTLDVFQVDIWQKNNMLMKTCYTIHNIIIFMKLCC